MNSGPRPVRPHAALLWAVGLQREGLHPPEEGREADPRGAHQGIRGQGADAPGQEEEGHQQGHTDAGRARPDGKISQGVGEGDKVVK